MKETENKKEMREIKIQPKVKLPKETVNLVFNEIAIFSFYPINSDKLPRVFYFYLPDEMYGSILLRDLYEAAKHCKFALYVFLDDVDKKHDLKKIKKLLSIRALCNDVSFKDLVKYDVPKKIPKKITDLECLELFKKLLKKSTLFNKKVLEPYKLDSQSPELFIILETGELLDREIIVNVLPPFLLKYICEWSLSYFVQSQNGIQNTKEE